MIIQIFYNYKFYEFYIRYRTDFFGIHTFNLNVIFNEKNSLIIVYLHTILICHTIRYIYLSMGKHWYPVCIVWNDYD